MPQKIMVVDDKESLCSLVKAYLTKEGFEVVTANNGRQALIVARHENPDLVLLDIMMPEMDGYEFIRLFGREQQKPIILLTAKLDETDKVLGLELGADDYITKPFSMREMVARIRAVLRRAAKKSEGVNLMRAGELTIDIAGRMCKVGAQTVELTPSEFDLLVAMMREPGRAFSRLDLLEKLQGGALEAYERTIDVHIRNLRSKIESDPRNPTYVETVYGFGYRFSSAFRDTIDI